MKLVLDKQLQDKVKGIEIRAEQKQEFTYLGSGKDMSKKGLKLWELNLATFDLKEAEIKKSVSIGIDGNEKHHSKVVTNKGCKYFWALNQKNAIDKSAKMIAKLMD